MTVHAFGPLARAARRDQNDTLAQQLEGVRIASLLTSGLGEQWAEQPLTQQWQQVDAAKTWGDYGPDPSIIDDGLYLVEPLTDVPTGVTGQVNLAAFSGGGVDLRDRRRQGRLRGLHPPAGRLARRTARPRRARRPRRLSPRQRRPRRPRQPDEPDLVGRHRHLHGSRLGRRVRLLRPGRHDHPRRLGRRRRVRRAVHGPAGVPSAAAARPAARPHRQRRRQPRRRPAADHGQRLPAGHKRPDVGPRRQASSSASSRASTSS